MSHRPELTFWFYLEASIERHTDIDKMVKAIISPSVLAVSRTRPSETSSSQPSPTCPTSPRNASA